MMFVFLRMLFIKEQNVSARKLTQKSQSDNINSNEKISERINTSFTNDEENENCLGKYLSYYIYAFVLGAYINVKKLYKMGPI